MSIEIPLSKTKLILGLIAAVFFVICGAWLLLNVAEFERASFRIMRNPMFIRIIGTASIVFFAAVGLYACSKLFDTKVGLTIDDEGLIDNSNASSVGRIYWKDISGFRTKQVMSTKFLLIDLRNPEAYIQNAGGKIKSRLLRSNMKMYGTPLSITTNTLKYDFKALEKLLHSEYENYLAGK